MTKLELKKLKSTRKAPLPEFIDPELATLVKEPTDGPGWLHELKFDGYRMLCTLNRREVRFWSRNRKDWTARFPNVEKALRSFPATTAILDGEIVVMDDKGHTSFQLLQRAMGGGGDTAFVFAVFDLLYLDGYNLTGVALIERKLVLQQLFSAVADGGPLRYSDHVEGNGKKFFRQACDFGIEGIVSKRADAHYISARTHDWLKIKCARNQEFVIVGYTPSKKGLPGFGSLILGVYEKGKLIYAGRVGTGFSLKQREEIARKLDRLSRSSSPLAVIPKEPGLRQAHWAKPKLVAEVTFTEWTADGSIRHPSFQGLREDKAAEEVRREVPKKTPAARRSSR